jgi:hypothetical protein
MKPFTAAFLSLLLGNAALLAQQTSNIAGLGAGCQRILTEVSYVG